MFAIMAIYIAYCRPFHKVVSIVSYINLKLTYIYQLDHSYAEDPGYNVNCSKSLFYRILYSAFSQEITKLSSSRQLHAVSIETELALFSFLFRLKIMLFCRDPQEVKNKITVWYCPLLRSILGDTCHDKNKQNKT